MEKLNLRDSGSEKGLKLVNLTALQGLDYFSFSDTEQK